MLNGSIVRCLLIIAFTYAAYRSVPFEGLPWWLDGWLGLVVRSSRNSKQLLLLMAGLTLAGELVGALLPSCAIRLRRRTLVAVLVIVVALPALWSLRVSSWLGDLHRVDKSPFPSQMIETAEPLGTSTYYFAVWVAKQLELKPSFTLQIMTVVFGAFAVGAIFLWAERASPEWPLVFLMLVSTGSMVLFCGYPEKGTPKSVALLPWYLYAGTRALREPGRGWDHLSSALLALSALMHGSVAVILPAHAWYIWRSSGLRRAAVGIALFFGLIGLIVTAVLSGVLTFHGRLAGNMTAPIFWIKKYCITNCGYDFFSRSHFADVLNYHLLLAPFAMLCLAEACWHARTEVERWLMLSTLGCVFLSVIWFPVFGYRGDWDIFVLTPLVMSYFTIQVALRVIQPHHFRRFACAWIACSAVHTVTWWLYFQSQL